MVKAHFRRQITPSVVGLTLLAFNLIACPDRTQAKLPIQPEVGQLPNVVPVRRTAESYKIGGGDRIQIEILEVPELSRAYEVLSDGSVNLPLIGLVSLRGRTLVEATDVIRIAYRRILKDPIVTVSLVTARPLNVGVIGEVNRPGSYTLNLTAGVGVAPAVQYPTVIQALKTAEGITGLADIRNIQIRRPQPTGSDILLTVNLWKFLQEGDISQDIILQDRDTIVVPTVTSFNQAEARQIANTNFSPPPEKPRSISIVGEVNSPGSYVVIGGNTKSDLSREGFATVTRAIQLAGGITALADIRQIQVRRPTRAGEQIISVNLWQLLESGDASQDAILQQGDTIIVPKVQVINPAEAGILATTNFSPPGINIYVVGEVRTPTDALKLPSNTTLNQALLARGFFGYENARAKRESVDLVRLNPDGTTIKRRITIDLTVDTNEENNPLLRNNDIIVVHRSSQAVFSDRLGNALSPLGTFTGVGNFLLMLRSLFGF
jgi:polysaccharide export outer membrane protein